MGIISAQTNVNCFGGNDGSATVTVAGGTPGYSYMWSNLQTNSTAIDLIAGTYTVVVTDTHNCTTSTSVTITQPAATLTSGISAQTNVNCFGGNNGSATVTVAGGTPVYSYLWSNSQTSSIAINLISGTYSVTVTDTHGCTIGASTAISQPAAPLIVGISAQSNVHCFGENNGSVTVTVSGGTTLYSYLWSDASHQTTPTASNLVSGTYTVTVTDIHGCTTSLSAIVTQNPLPTPTITGNLTICNTSSTTLSTQSYIAYHWSTGGTGQSITVSPSINTTYTVTVTDNHGCTSSAMANVLVNALPTPGLTVQTNPICTGNTTSIATSVVYNGYKWSTGATAQSITVNPTANTTYTVTVTDGNTCTAKASVIITVTPTPTANIIYDPDSYCSDAGIVYVILTGTPGGTYSAIPPGMSIDPSTGSVNTGTSIGGYYRVTYTLVAHGGCSQIQASTFLQISQIPAKFTISGGGSYCSGGSGVNIFLSGSNQSIAYELWKNNVATGNILIGDGLPLTFGGISAPGVYTIKATDANLCGNNMIGDVVVTINPLPTATISKIDVSCFNGSNGSATVSADNGTPGYHYSWNNSQTNSQAINLIAGTYTVTVIDLNGCTATAQTTVTQPSAALITGVSAQTNVSCFGKNDGSATVSVTGGTLDYTYLWNTIPQQSSTTANGLID